MRLALSGGATGIGAEILARAKAKGWHVTVFDIAEVTSADCYIPIDLSDPEAILRAAAAAEGPFDALINNAGLPPREGLAQTVLAVNWFGTRDLTRAMLPKLADGAAIVTTASRAGGRWRENIPEIKALLALDGPADLPTFIEANGIGDRRAYDLSKEAVIVWTLRETEALLAQGLRANTLSPGAVSTGILDDFIAAFGPMVAANIKRVGRPTDPGEAADLALFLAGPDSAWIKGQDIVIDGGMAALASVEMLGLSD